MLDDQYIVVGALDDHLSRWLGEGRHLERQGATDTIPAEARA